MTNRKIPINDATEAELRQFARDTLGLEIKLSASKARVLAEVTSAWDKPDIVLTGAAHGAADEPEPEAPEARSASNPPSSQKHPAKGKVRIYVAITEEPGGTDAVPVSVNGKAMLIPRGKNVDVPYPYYEALSRAIQYRFDSKKDERGNDAGLDPVPRKVQLYPFQVVDFNGMKPLEAA